MYNQISKIDCDKFSLMLFKIVIFGIISISLNVEIHKLDLWLYSCKP